MKLPPSAQVVSSCLLGSALVAIISARGSLVLFTTVLLVSFAILMGAYFIVFKLLLRWRESDKVHKEVVQELDRFRKMSIPDAKIVALSLLADRNTFVVIAQTASAQVTQALGMELREFFDRFESVTAIEGEISLSSENISPSSFRTGFLRIGTDSEFTEIVARPEEDRVFVIDGTESQDPSSWEGYPSIYHLLLVYCGGSVRTGPMA